MKHKSVKHSDAGESLSYNLELFIHSLETLQDSLSEELLPGTFASTKWKVIAIVLSTVTKDNEWNLLDRLYYAKSIP